MTTWHAITSLGDSALLLPTIAWMAIALAWPPTRRRDTLRWIAAAVGCGGIVALSKLLFMGWGIGPTALNYTGFSGHTALSILVWPSFAAVLARHRTPVQRGIVIGIGALVGIAVAVSRLALDVHSPSEVIMGALVGAAIAAWFIQGLSSASAIPPWRPALLGLGAIAIACLCYGRVFPSQHLLQDIALWASGHHGVFTRRVSLH